MARALTGIIAGAAFALSAAAAAAAFAQAGAPADGARAQQEADRDSKAGQRVIIERKGPDGERTVRREERRIVIRDGDHEFAFAGHGGPGGHHMDMAEHLRTMLQLKPGQEAALQAYVTAVRPAMGQHMMAMADHKDGEPAKTTTERLADMEKRMAEQQAAAHARIEATRRFYAQLEPSQKKVFDEMPLMMIGPMGPIGPMMGLPMKIRFEHGPGGAGERYEYRIERHGGPPPVPPVPPTPPAPPRL